jgi:GTP-binding protein
MNSKVDTPIMAVKPSQYPEKTQPEWAVFGRSNVGKSSLLNALMNRKNLAYTSSTPGKTLTINFYPLEEGATLVDLPGYGYAKGQKGNDFSPLFDAYIASTRIDHALVLVDSRQTVQPLDEMMITTLKQYAIPFFVVATKADKLNQSEKHHAKIAFTQAWDLNDDSLFFVSSLKKTHINTLEAALLSTLSR